MFNIFNAGVNATKVKKKMESIIESVLNDTNICSSDASQNVSIVARGNCNLKNTNISQKAVENMKCIQKSKTNDQFVNNLTDKLYNEAKSKSSGFFSLGANVSKTDINEKLKQSFTTDILQKATSNINQNMTIDCGDSAQISNTKVSQDAKSSVDQLTDVLNNMISKNSIYSDTKTETESGDSSSSLITIIVIIIIIFVLLIGSGVAYKTYNDKKKSLSKNEK